MILQGGLSIWRRTGRKTVGLWVLPVVLFLLTGPVPTQTIDVEELTLEERRTTRTSQAEDVQRAALARDGTKRFVPQDVLLFWIATPPDPRFSMPTGLPVPSGLEDCHTLLATDTIGMGIRPRIPVAERRVERATDTDVRTCPSGQVGAGVHYQRTKTTIRTNFDEIPPAGLYSGPAGPPPAPETPPGSGVFDTGWLV